MILNFSKQQNYLICDMLSRHRIILGVETVPFKQKLKCGYLKYRIMCRFLQNLFMGWTVVNTKFKWTVLQKPFLRNKAENAQHFVCRGRLTNDLSDFSPLKCTVKNPLFLANLVDFLSFVAKRFGDQSGDLKKGINLGMHDLISEYLNVWIFKSLGLNQGILKCMETYIY